MTDDGHTTIDDEQIEFDSSVLIEHKEELDKMFRMYIEGINPFMVRFETAKTEFPIEIQNEIRAIYGHLARAAMSKDKEHAAKNIEKMHSHSKRALRDCYKYNSIVLSDRYDDFMDRYAGVDLTYLENGDFLKRVVGRCNEARKKLQDAKIKETTNLSEDQKYEAYEEAYKAFELLNFDLENAENSASYLKHKATRKDKMAGVSFAVGIVGVIVGILGIFF